MNKCQKIISFSNLEIDCFIGVYQEEKEQKQRVIINIQALMPEDYGAENDNVHEILNYEVIRNTCIRICTTEHTHLIETVAQRIFEELSNLPQVSGLRINVAKPQAFADCQSVAYSIADF